MPKLGATFLASMIIFYAVVDLLRGETIYSNYWGGQVFAPIAIIGGVLIIYVVWFRSKHLQSRHRDKSEYPWKDYHKW